MRCGSVGFHGPEGGCGPLLSCVVGVVSGPSGAGWKRGGALPGGGEGGGPGPGQIEVEGACAGVGGEAGGQVVQLGA